MINEVILSPFAIVFKNRTLIFCGEVVTVGLLERCMKTLGHVQFLNLYSISEAHDVACADLTQWHHTEQVCFYRIWSHFPIPNQYTGKFHNSAA